METHTHQKCCSSDCCPSHGHEWARVDVKNFDEIKSVERSAGDSAERGCSCCGEVAGESEEVFWLNVAMLAVGALMLAVGLMGEKYISETQRWLLYGAPWLLCGWPVLKGAWQSVRRGRFFDEFTLMGGAAIAAICLGELAEALGVMIFYQIGEMFQEQAAGRSRSSIRALLATKPSVARVVRGGEFVTMVPEDVEKGMRVLVKPGEKIPVDGLVVAGESRVDTSPITGEPVPVRVVSGASVFGGTVSLDGTLTVEASGAFEDSGMARIMNMVENAIARKSPVERFITKFAAVYTPVMFGVALLTALVPPLIGLGIWRDWIYRALVVLMISCPCALVISIPLGYFGGIGAASRRGILVKGGNVLDAVNEVSVVAFDKTGTLTRGVFEVANVSPADGVTEDELKRAALITESLSNHPVARSMQKAFGGTPGAVPAGADITSREVAGKGVIAVYDGEQYAAGSMNLMKDLGVAAVPDESAGTLVCVARGNRFLGSVAVSDVLKADAVRAVSRLRERGVKSYMLTGDRREGAAWVADRLDLDGYRAELLPEMKVYALDELAGDAAAKAAFVGDGVNDAPLLASARVGVAMGALGSEAAIEVADAVVLNDAPSRVADLMDIAARTRRIVRENIVMALATKAAFMVLGIVGIAGLWEAIFADVGVALLAILNATRVGRG